MRKYLQKYIWKGVHTQNRQRTHTTEPPKIQLKIGTEHFPKEYVQVAKRHMKLSLIPPIIWEMHIKRTRRLSPHTWKTGYHPKHNKYQVLVQMWRVLMHFVGKIHWYSHYGKQYTGPQEINSTTTMWCRNYTWKYLSHETKPRIQKDIHTLMFMALCWQ